jgi:hypothetical protein
MSTKVQNCHICTQAFADLDSLINCDGCSLIFRNKCAGLSASEIKCLSLKNRNLKFFCESCNKGLRDIPELKALLNRLLVEVNELKNLKENNNKNELHCSEEVIINEVAERNIRAFNLLFYNIPESNSDNINDRIYHDSNIVNNIIESIIIGDSIIRPTKLIRLGIRGQNKTRPIKAIFSSPTHAFEILKLKKKLLFQNPPSTYGISSDRTLYQRNYMKNLREELETQRLNSEETNLIIKYVRGTPTIVSRNDRLNHRNTNVL